MTGAAIVYLRGEQLDADDIRDLEAYHDALRVFYDIPEGAPVFPKRTSRSRTEPLTDKKPKQTEPRATGVNGDAHPWRNTL